MRLSLHTDYALRTLMFLAGRQGRATTTDVAEFFDISKDHVAKVAQRLTRLGWVRSLRGPGGGLELARDPKQIRIGEIVRGFEGNTHLLECVGSVQRVCVIQPGCRLRSVLAEAERVQMQYLDSVRLADVVEPGRDLITWTELDSGGKPA